MRFSRMHSASCSNSRSHPIRLPGIMPKVCSELMREKL